MKFVTMNTTRGMIPMDQENQELILSYCFKKTCTVCVSFRWSKNCTSSSWMIKRMKMSNTPRKSSSMSLEQLQMNNMILTSKNKLILMKKNTRKTKEQTKMMTILTNKMTAKTMMEYLKTASPIICSVVGRAVTMTMTKKKNLSIEIHFSVKLKQKSSL